MQQYYWDDSPIGGGLLPILENTTDNQLLNTLVYLVADVDCEEIPDLPPSAFRRHCRDAAETLMEEGMILPDELRRRINHQAKQVGVRSLT